MAEGFLKSGAQFVNSLATTLGRRSQRPPAESETPSMVPTQAAPLISGFAPALGAGTSVEEVVEQRTGVHPALDAQREPVHERQTVPAGNPGQQEASAHVMAVPRAPHVPDLLREFGVGDSSRPSAPRDAADAPAMTSEHALRAANLEFEARVGDRLELPLGVLLNQRDRALREAVVAQQEADRRIQEVVAEHDRLMALVLGSHAEQVMELEQALSAERVRARELELLLQGEDVSLESGPNNALPEPLPNGEGAASTEPSALNQTVDSLQAEVEQTRLEAVRLQGERDEAIRATDEVRLELQAEAQAVRDELIELQARLDETERLLADTRDQARDQLETLEEHIEALQRQLAERQ